MKFFREMLVTGPLYIPEPGRKLIPLLVEKGSVAFATELERLAALGSPWAATVLGYICAMPDETGSRQLDRAIELCQPVARAGDAYAQYVLAWAYFLRDKTDEHGGAPFREAIRQQFVPAILDMVLLPAYSQHNTAENSAILLRLKTVARHKGAFLALCGLYQKGGLGVTRLLLGYLLAPIAWLRYVIAWRNDPYALNVFYFDRHNTNPVLKVSSQNILANC